MPYLGLEHIESSTGRILVSEAEAELVESKSNNFLFTPKHVLYGKLRPYLNKVALPTFSGRCTTEVIPLLPKGVDRQWLTWLLRRQDTVDYAMLGKTGSRMPRASMRDLMKMFVPVPPLKEQNRIVAQLEIQLAAAERARRAAQAQLDALDAMPGALLREIFPRSPSERLPLGWRSVKLGDLCTWGSGGTPRKGKAGYYGGPIPWAVIADLPDTVVYETANTITELALLESSAKIVPSDALLIAMYGSIGKLGITGRPMATNQAIAHAIPGENVDLHWLFWRLRHDRQALTDQGKGITQSNISQTILKKWEVPLPPIDEQRVIVAELMDGLAALDLGRAATQARLDSANALPAALLRLAFSA